MSNPTLEEETKNRLERMETAVSELRDMFGQMLERLPPNIKQDPVVASHFARAYGDAKHTEDSLTPSKESVGKQTVVKSDLSLGNIVATEEDNMLADQEQETTIVRDLPVHEVEVMRDSLTLVSTSTSLLVEKYQISHLIQLITHFLSMHTYFYLTANIWNMHKELMWVPIKDFAKRRPPKEPGKE